MNISHELQSPSAKSDFCCAICRGAQAVVAYEGPIRLGRFGHLSEQNYRLFQCQTCQSIALPSIFDQTSYYESNAYRTAVDGDASSDNFYQLHDEEQLQHLTILGTQQFRHKTIADIGCGAGSFLDAVRGFAKQAIAVEPSQHFREILTAKGLPVYPYAQDALADFGQKVDLASTFSVLEHIEDPLAFLKDIHALLGTDGQLALSTPNAEDILLELLPQEYASFFYRKVHLWYFSATALTNLLHQAGFQQVEIIPHQRFGLGNFLSWVQHKRPMGNVELGFISKTMDQVWKTELERSGRCDYLYALARK